MLCKNLFFIFLNFFDLSFLGLHIELANIFNTQTTCVIIVVSNLVLRKTNLDFETAFVTCSMQIENFNGHNYMHNSGSLNGIAGLSMVCAWVRHDWIQLG